MKRININLIILVMMLTGVSQAWGGGEMIQKGSTVKLDYTLTVGGQTVDTSEGKEPLQYVHGQGMLIRGLEQSLEGLKAGDAKKVSVNPEDGYGTVDSQSVVEVPKEQLADTGGQDVSVGQVLVLNGKNGQQIKGIVTEVKDNSLVINFNHPLAGKVLDFDITIVSVENL